MASEPRGKRGKETRIEARRLRQARKKAGRQHERCVRGRQHTPAEVVAGLELPRAAGRRARSARCGHPRRTSTGPGSQACGARRAGRSRTAPPCAPQRASRRASRSARIRTGPPASPRGPSPRPSPSGLSSRSASGSRGRATPRVERSSRPGCRRRDRPALQLSAARFRGTAPPPARRVRARRTRLADAMSPGYVPRDSPMPRLSSAMTAMPFNARYDGEDVELVSSPRARAVHHHGRREGAAAGRQRERRGDDSDAHLTLAKSKPHVARPVPRKASRVHDDRSVAALVAQ